MCEAACGRGRGGACTTEENKRPTSCPPSLPNFALTPSPSQSTESDGPLYVPVADNQKILLGLRPAQGGMDSMFVREAGGLR